MCAAVALEAASTSTHISGIVQKPIFIEKFHFFRKSQSLGYILNNVVGVVFSDGEHIIGHSRSAFKHLEEVCELESEMLIDNLNISSSKLRPSGKL